MDPQLQPLDLRQSIALAHAGRRTLCVAFRSGTTASFTALGPASSAITLRVFGDRDCRVMTFKDTFSAFKAALEHFVRIVRGRDEPPPRERLLRIVDLIEAGLSDA